MKRSTDRILTTHVGSLPRPPDLLEFLEARETGRPVEQAAFDGCLAASVHEIVRKQVAAGIDSVCDGELVVQIKQMVPTPPSSSRWRKRGPGPQARSPPPLDARFCGHDAEA